jgi:hypothetical protein
LSYIPSGSENLHFVSKKEALILHFMKNNPTQRIVCASLARFLEFHSVMDAATRAGVTAGAVEDLGHHGEGRFASRAWDDAARRGRLPARDFYEQVEAKRQKTWDEDKVKDGDENRCEGDRPGRRQTFPRPA